MSKDMKQTGLCEAKKTKASFPIPHDLVVEILSWLPAYNLWRLRHVCKTWFQLITTNPHLATLHLDRSIEWETSPIVISRRYRSEKYYLAKDLTTCDNAIQLESPFEQEEGKGNSGYIVRGICNGLLCFSSWKKEEDYIWNPITNDYVTLPCTPTQSWFSDRATAKLVAFGFHPGTNQYKICKVFNRCDYNVWPDKFDTQAFVYTLGLNSSWRILVDDMPYWRTIHTPIPFKRTFMFPLVNGAIHWFMGDNFLLLVAIIAFDLKHELFRKLPLPEHVNLKYQQNCELGIAEFGGMLCIFCAHKNVDIQIWAMKEYGTATSWTKQYIIGKPEIGGSFDFLRPLCILAHNGDLVLKINRTQLILYHPKTNSVTYLKDFAFKNLDFLISTTYACVGSIISPKVISGGRHILT